MKRTLSGLTKLTRFSEFGYFIVITTLLGIAAAQGSSIGRLLLVLLANWLAISFAYMINDIEDAPEDAFSPKNFARNPVSKGIISPKTARNATIAVGLAAALVYALLGLWPFIFGIACLVLGLLYSLKTIRLKTMALIDIISRGLLLAGLPFLCGYFSFTATLIRTWFWPFLFVLSLSVYYEHHDQPRYDEGYQLSRARKTAALFGERYASLVMTVLVIVVVTTGMVTFFVINLLPAWVLLTMTALFLLFALPPYISIRRGKSNELPQDLLISALERAGAMALILKFLVPWLGQLFR